MQVVKNMLALNSNKGPFMKSFLVLLIPFVLLGCGAEPDAPTEEALSAALAESDAAAQDAAVNATKDSEPAPNASGAAQADALAAIKTLGGQSSARRKVW